MLGNFYHGSGSHVAYSSRDERSYESYDRERSGTGESHEKGERRRSRSRSPVRDRSRSPQPRNRSRSPQARRRSPTRRYDGVVGERNHRDKDIRDRRPRRERNVRYSRNGYDEYVVRHRISLSPGEERRRQAYDERKLGLKGKREKSNVMCKEGGCGKYPNISFWYCFTHRDKEPRHDGDGKSKT